MNLRSLVALFVALSMIAMSATALAEDAPRKKKKYKDTGPTPELFVGAGMNMCMADGDSKCKEVDETGAEQDISPSWNAFFAGGVRINKHVGVYLDVTYGALAPNQPTGVDVTINLLTVMPTVRGFFRPSKEMELFGGLGVGYTNSMYEASGGGTTVTGGRTNLTDLKLNVGGFYYINHKIGIGLNVDYIFLRNSTGESCADAGSGEECSQIADAPEDVDIADALQPSLIGRFTF